MSTSPAPQAVPQFHGWKRLICGALRRIRAKRLHVMYLYRHDLEHIPAIAPAPGGWIEVLDPAQVERLREVYPVDMAEKRRRLAAGHICYIGLLDGKVAHFNWVQSNGVRPIQDTGRRCRVRPGEIWVYSARTATAAQGRHLYSAGLGVILEDARRKGYSRAWIYTHRENLVSQRVIERLGFRLVKKLRALELRGRYIPLP